MKKWTVKDMPNLSGKTAIITGGTSGLGFEDALELSRVGAKVIITGRDTNSATKSVESIRKQIKDADISFELLDLADLESVRNFSEVINRKIDSLDILINNAGVMTPPKRLVTKDNLELQFGTNYLGHFALTAHLLPLLKKSKARVISLSSVAARRGRINFDDLQAEKAYVPMTVYSQSKVACLMFALELHRQSDKNNWGITSIAAHPGISRTNLLVDKPGQNSITGMLRKYAWFLFQLPARGALTTLYAASSPDVQPGAYYGPDGFKETRGYPKLVNIPVRALDKEVSAKLWDLSTKLAEVSWK